MVQCQECIYRAELGDGKIYCMNMDGNSLERVEPSATCEHATSKDGLTHYIMLNKEDMEGAQDE